MRSLTGLSKRETSPELRSALVEDLSTNLLSWYSRATRSQRARGRYWYTHARDVADAIAERASLSREQAAALIAVYSPRCSWDENIVRAEESARTGVPAPSVNDQVSKAAAILAGEDPDPWVRGPKVRRFWHNIMGDWSHVTVDIWHVRAATDNLEAGDREYKLTAGTEHRYGILEEATVRAAQAAKLTPAEFQAVVWLVVREWKNPLDNLPDAL